MTQNILSEPLDTNWDNLIPNMFLNPTFSDVTIETSDQHFPAHKIILGLKSSVFKAMFKNEIAERRTYEVHIDDFSADAVKTMLNCIYDPSVLVPSISAIGHETLLYLADKYDIKTITDSIGDYLIANMHEVNVVDTAILAHRLNNKKIKKAVFEAFFRSSCGAFKREDLANVLGHDLCAELFAFIDGNLGRLDHFDTGMMTTFFGNGGGGGDY